MGWTDSDVSCPGGCVMGNAGFLHPRRYERTVEATDAPYRYDWGWPASHRMFSLRTLRDGCF